MCLLCGFQHIRRQRRCFNGCMNCFHFTGRGFDFRFRTIFPCGNGIFSSGRLDNFSCIHAVFRICGNRQAAQQAAQCKNDRKYSAHGCTSLYGFKWQTYPVHQLYITIFNHTITHSPHIYKYICKYVANCLFFGGRFTIQAEQISLQLNREVHFTSFRFHLSQSPSFSVCPIMLPRLVQRPGPDSRKKSHKKAGSVFTNPA